jgi:dynein heavy chain
MTKPVSISSSDTFARLWMHECCRVFHDRLINAEDKKWFTRMLIESSNVFFRVRLDHDETFVNNHLLFGDLLKLDSSRAYEEIKDMNKLKTVLLE